jgi:hypothetical protein
VPPIPNRTVSSAGPSSRSSSSATATFCAIPGSPPGIESLTVQDQPPGTGNRNAASFQPSPEMRSPGGIVPAPGAA